MLDAISLIDNDNSEIAYLIAIQIRQQNKHTPHETSCWGFLVVIHVIVKKIMNPKLKGHSLFLKTIRKVYECEHFKNMDI